jgi:hypothetical protein
MTSAQKDALWKFAQAGGHGFGEFSGISRPTAHVLERKGLITVSYVSLSHGKKMALGTITGLGREALAR